MRIEFVEDVERFATVAGSFLASDEANHTVLLSALQVARRARVSGEMLPDPWVSALVLDDDRVVAAARLHRGTWLLSKGPAEALRALGSRTREHGPFTGFVGPEESVQAFEQGSGVAAQTHAVMPLMRLAGTPVLPRPVAGALRTATLADIEQVRAWLEAFRVEARITQTAEQVAADVDRMLRAETQYLWIDDAGQAGGLVGGRLIAPSGARIGPVYTPPAQRGLGFGGAMVTLLAQRLLDAGALCVFLFTDAANPTSNALYQRIGFVPIGRHLHRVVSA